MGDITKELNTRYKTVLYVTFCNGRQNLFHSDGRIFVYKK